MGNKKDTADRTAEFGRSYRIAVIPQLLITWVTRTLPANARGRYREEFSAELVELSPARQIVHAFGLILMRTSAPAPSSQHVQ